MLIHRQCVYQRAVKTLAFAWLLLFPARAPGQASDSPVTVVVCDTLDWTQGRVTLLAELRASGFAVQVVPSDARTPGQLIDVLRQTGSAVDHLGGIVSVLAGPERARAYVWLPERDDLIQVDAPADDHGVAADVLALKVVELLRVKLAAPLPATPEAARERADAAAPARPVEPHRPFTFWLLGGPELEATSGSAALQMGLGGRWAWSTRWGIELSAAGTASASELQHDSGSMRLSTTRVAAHPSFSSRGDDGLWYGLGAGAGISLLTARLVAAADFEANDLNEVFPFVSARGRAGWTFGSVSVFASAELGFAFVDIELLADDRMLSQYGGPFLFGAAGVAWHL